MKYATFLYAIECLTILAVTKHPNKTINLLTTMKNLLNKKMCQIGVDSQRSIFSSFEINIGRFLVFYTPTYKLVYFN